ncbi:MAG: hypothetical protein KDK64_04600 [Chlamydiia bacterium]|nr:hypothetical protein [Chlamydiia bacterium]
MQKGKKYSFLLASLLAGLFYFLYIPLPSSKHPYRLYSTDHGDDLKEVLKKSIRASKQSITLHSYAITDLGILSLLKKKGQEGVNIHLIYDDQASPHLKGLQENHLFLYPIRGKGLMHEKIWIFDETLLFLGSTNLTPSSLKMHDNLMVGLYAPSLAQALSAGRPEKYAEQIGSRKLLYYSLPSQEALETLLKTLDQTQKTVKISLFTFTHSSIVNKLIQLHQRGVKVKITLDRTTAQGASQKARKALEGAGIQVRESSGRELMHHKCAEIDNKIFIIGSANWTQSAFNKNRDFLLFIYY